MTTLKTPQNKFDEAYKELTLIAQLLFHEGKVSQNTYDIIHNRLKEMRVNTSTTQSVIEEMLQVFKPFTHHPLFMSATAQETQGWEGSYGQYSIIIRKK